MKKILYVSALALLYSTAVHAAITQTGGLKQAGTSTDELSSGYKINRAADDAAAALGDRAITGYRVLGGGTITQGCDFNECWIFTWDESTKEATNLKVWGSTGTKEDFVRPGDFQEKWMSDDILRAEYAFENGINVSAVFYEDDGETVRREMAFVGQNGIVQSDKNYKNGRLAKETEYDVDYNDEGVPGVYATFRNPNDCSNNMCIKIVEDENGKPSIQLVQGLSGEQLAGLVFKDVFFDSEAELGAMQNRISNLSPAESMIRDTDMAGSGLVPTIDIDRKIKFEKIYDLNGYSKVYDGNGKLIGRYNPDGTVYEAKRIYTVDEASELVRDDYNTFTINYR